MKLKPKTRPAGCGRGKTKAGRGQGSKAAPPVGPSHSVAAATGQAHHSARDAQKLPSFYELKD